MEEEFEDDLQLFAHKVGIIVALESNRGNCITTDEAYKEIKALWKKLKKKKKSSGGKYDDTDDGATCEKTR